MKLSKDTYLFKIKQCLFSIFITRSKKKNFEIRLEQKVTIRALNEIKKNRCSKLSFEPFFFNLTY